MQKPQPVTLEKPTPSIPAEANDIITAPRFTPPARPSTTTIPCYDPATMQSLGTVPALSPDDVRAAIAKCRAAQQQWSRSSYAQRRRLMRVLLKYVVDNQDTLCRYVGWCCFFGLGKKEWPACLPFPHLSHPPFLSTFLASPPATRASRAWTPPLAKS